MILQNSVCEQPKLKIKLALLVVFSVFLLSISDGARAEKLTVYSARAKHLIEPFFKEYTKQTGVPIRFITDKAGVLRQRLLFEKENTSADILLTVDVGNLWKAAQDGLLAEVDSAQLNRAIPTHLKDEKNRWFALTVRARTLVYSPSQVKLKEVTNYADLAKDKWYKKLCLRTSKKVYNQSLVAMLIYHYGEGRTAEIVRGWVKNLAHEPYAKDSHVIQAVSKNECAVGLVNTYYYGRKIKEDPTFRDRVKLAWLGQSKVDFGTHVNISGAGVVKYSKNKKQAIKLLEWLSSIKVQEKFASVNLEYPSNPKAKTSPIIQEWGDFKSDQSPLYLAGKYQVQAVKLMDRMGYK